MNDELKIFALYQEAVEEQPKMIQWADGTKAWYLHGKLHRVDAPAVERAYGTKEWWLHGELHREGAPAIEYPDGGKEWYLHGRLHRMDGPAIERANGHKEWYLHGNYYESAEAWAEASLQMQNKSCDAADVDAFLKQILKQNAEESL